MINIQPEIENRLKKLKTERGEYADTCDWFCSGSCVSDCGRCEYCDCDPGSTNASYKTELEKVFRRFKDSQ